MASSSLAIRPLLRAFAAHDWLLLAYLTALFLRVLAGHGERRTVALECLAFDLVVFALILVLMRGGVFKNEVAGGLVYRAGLLLPILGSFFQLQYILPSASGPPLDAELYAFDMRVFGFEPALSWDRFVTPTTTEWFAFFYYGYFFIIAVHVLPPLFFGRDSQMLRRLAFGFMWTYCVGHLTYTLLPAYGPYAYLAPRFTHTLDGSFWWPLVKRAAESVDEGSRTDVFPSLHTAVPTFLTLFSFQHRARLPFRYTWLPLGLFTSQIILATMFLRWHYFVDIFGGIALAISGLLVSRAALRFDARRTVRAGTSVWPPPFRPSGRPAADVE